MEVYNNISNANICTSCGEGIISISYDKKTKKGTVIFEKDIDRTFFWNFYINHKNEYGNLIYKRLIAPKLITEESTIKGQTSYNFTFSQLWDRTYDKDDNLISFDVY